MQTGLIVDWYDGVLPGNIRLGPAGQKRIYRVADTTR